MKILRISCISALLSFGLMPAFGQGAVRVYGWGDYIDPKVIEDFTKETGIKVSYDSYDSDETIDSRLQGGKTGFDVVILSGRVLQREIAKSLLLKLDKSRLPNSKTLWLEVMDRLAAYDPGNQYAVNYFWFTAGIAYNIDKAKEIAGVTSADLSLGTPNALLATRPIDSWSTLFRPENLKQFASCGIEIIDSPDDLFAIALHYLHLDPGSNRQLDIKRAADLLSGIGRDAKKFEPIEYSDALAKGDICLAVGYSVESFHARDRAREAENGIEIGYALPKEGAPILFDNLAIPKDAPDIAEAYALIDFLLRPEVAARNTNFTHLANGVLASKSAVDKRISSDLSIYPDPAAMQRLFATPVRELATEKLVAREWAQIKGGR